MDVVLPPVVARTHSDDDQQHEQRRATTTQTTVQTALSSILRAHANAPSVDVPVADPLPVFLIGYHPVDEEPMEWLATYLARSLGSLGSEVESEVESEFEVGFQVVVDAAATTAATTLTPTTRFLTRVQPCAGPVDAGRVHILLVREDTALDGVLSSSSLSPPPLPPPQLQLPLDMRAEESYRLDAGPSRIDVRAATMAGTFLSVH